MHGYSSISVSDELFEQLGVVIAEYDCDTPAESIEALATVAHPSETKPNLHRSSPIDWQRDRLLKRFTVISTYSMVFLGVESRRSAVIPRSTASLV